MTQMPDSGAWLNRVSERLQSDGFEFLPPQSFQTTGFRLTARQARFEITKFGMAETFFVFADIHVLTPELMARFSNDAFQFALRSKTILLPCGLFESVWCFAVAITANLDPQVAHSIRFSAPPKHWSSGEMPVAFDALMGQLSYFEQTPIWGAAYYAGFRKQIERYLR